MHPVGTASRNGNHLRHAAPPRCPLLKSRSHLTAGVPQAWFGDLSR